MNHKNYKIYIYMKFAFKIGSFFGKVIVGTLAWKIPWMEEPGRLQSMGSRRV